MRHHRWKVVFSVWALILRSSSFNEFPTDNGKCLAVLNQGATERLSATFSCFLFLGGCASLPDDFEQVPSQGWPHPEQTTLGALIAETAPEDPTLSGVELLADPGEAFATRFAIAAFAEKIARLAVLPVERRFKRSACCCGGRCKPPTGASGFDF